MQKFAVTLFQIIGKICGMLFSPFCGHRFDFLRYVFSYSYVTALYSSRFKSFGHDSKLVGAPDELRLSENISVGNFSRLGRHLLLRCYKVSDVVPEIAIGTQVNIGDYSTLSCCNKIVICDGVRLGRMVMITDNAHGHTDTIEELHQSPIDRPLVSKGPVYIEKNVWIGEKATILPGVTIGEGAIIAANAVVTHSVPPFSIAAGCPAKIVRTFSVK